MNIDIFSIRSIFQKPIVKHIVIFFAYLAFFLFMCIQDFSNMIQSAGGKYKENFYYIFVLGILYMLSYAYILFYKEHKAIKEKKDIVLAGLLLGQLILSCIGILFLILTINIVTIEFDKNVLDMAPIHYLGQNTLYYRVIIFLIPILGIFLVFRDEILSRKYAEYVINNKGLYTNKVSVLQNLFIGASDLNVVMNKGYYKGDKCNTLCIPVSVQEHIPKKVDAVLNHVQESGNADSSFYLMFGPYEIFGALKFCEIVGGDYYDIWLDTQNTPARLILSVFDICGHGIISYEYLSVIKTFLQKRQENFMSSSHNRIASNFRNFLIQYNKDFNSDIAIPFTICQIESGGKIDITNIGNPPPIIFSENNLSILPSRKMLYTDLKIHNKYLDYPPEIYTTTLIKDNILLFGSDGLEANLGIDAKKKFAKYFQSQKNVLDIGLDILNDTARFSDDKYRDDQVFILIKPNTEGENL